MSHPKITISMPSLGLLALVGVLLASDMAARYGRAEPPNAAPKVVSAQEFRLTDAQGNTRGTFAVGADGSPALTLLDKQGKRRAAMSVTDAGESSIAFYEGDKIRADLAVQPDGNAGLLLLDKNAKTRLSCRLRADGTPLIALNDKDGKFRALLDAPADNSVGLSLKNTSGKDSIGLAVLPDDSPLAVLKDKNGKTVWGASDN